MTYKKYIKRDGKTYGPYIYKSRKENGKVITEYLGSATENAKKSEKFSNKSLFLTLGLIFVFLLMIFLINNPQLYSNPEIVYSEKNIQTYSITGNAVLVDLSEKTSNFFSKTKSIMTGFVTDEISETSETPQTETTEQVIEIQDDSTPETPQTPQTETTEQVIEIQDDSTPETTETTETTEEQEEQTEEVKEVVEEEQEITETLEETEKEQIEEELNETQETSETEIENSTLSPTPETEEFVNETEIITNQTISETNETSIISETNETIISETNETEIIVEKNLTKLIEEKIQTHQSKAIINKPVKWIKTFEIKDINTTENLNIILPKTANNITIKTGSEVQKSLNELQEYNKIINQSKKQEIINQDGKGITGMVSKDVENSKGFLIKLWRKIFSLRMTGYAISELEAQTQELITETQTEKIVDVKEISEKTNETQIAVEYFTDAPEVLEEVYENNNGKLVKVFADDVFDYKDVLAYTIVTEKNISISDLNKIRIYHYISADEFYNELEENEEEIEEVEEVIDDVEETIIEEIEEENETTEQEEIVEEENEEVNEINEINEINETNETNENNTQEIIETFEEVEEEVEEEQEKQEEQTEGVIEEQEEIIEEELVETTEELNEAEEQAQETTENSETSEQTTETETPQETITETQDVSSPETQPSESSEEQSAPITGGVINNINSQNFKNSVKKIFSLPINFFSKVFSDFSFTGKVVDEENESEIDDNKEKIAVISRDENVASKVTPKVFTDSDNSNDNNYINISVDNGSVEGAQVASMVTHQSDELDLHGYPGSIPGLGASINSNNSINQNINESEIINENTTLDNETDEFDETNETIENEIIINETSENEQIISNETEETITINNQSFVKVQIDFEAFDLDEDGFVDYIEWNVPHLSEQIYEIIYIEKAIHLDENKTFVKDVYDYVKEKDDNLTIVIPNEHYLRVTFEQVLDNTKDITIYAGSICNESIIINGTEVPCEIYEKKKQIDKIRSGL